MNHDSKDFHQKFSTSLENWMRTKNSALPPDTVSAYLKAAYEVFPAEREKVTLKIGEASEWVRGILKEYNSTSAAFITPCNPLGEQLSEVENETLCAEYEALLNRQGVAYFAGLGRDENGEWPGEKSFFIPRIERSIAIAQGNQLKQNAIVILDSRATPELVLLK